MPTPLFDLFGEPIRTPSKPSEPESRQLEMFNPAEIALVGVNCRPQLSLSPTSKLELMMQGEALDGKEDHPRLIE